MQTCTSDSVRSAAVAGRFYPLNESELRGEVTHCLQEALPSTGVVPKAMIVPHAGYVFSGPVAASAYAQWVPARGHVRRVVVLGPSHQVAFKGVAAPSVDYFSSPLGLVRIDKDAVSEVAALNGVSIRDDAHDQEHSIEVQLPFLQVVLGEFHLVPLVVGTASPESVAGVLDTLWGGDETLVVISSDLSHFETSETARRKDAETAKAIVNLSFENLRHSAACGLGPICGLLLAARRRGMKVSLLDLRNSGDTSGTSDRVVGYGAFALS